MPNYSEFKMSVDHRVYTLKIYGEPILFPVSDIADPYRKCSLFISSESNMPITNKQPVNKLEVAFRNGDHANNVIAKLALNFDRDLQNLPQIKDKLKNMILVRVEQIITPATQKLGKLPL